MKNEKKYKETVEFNKSKNRNLSVIKSNRLIEARYKLSLNEQRLILLMVSLINPNDEDFKNIRIKIKDLQEILEINRKNLYEEMRNITKRLLTRVIELSNLKDNNLLQINWLSSAEYKLGEGILELSFDPKLKPYLLKLKEAFTIYNLQSVIKLRSSYAIRFYELLKQYEKIGKRKFKLEDLKNILGIERNEYKLYADFKRRVILPAYKELKEKTDIYFELEEQKKGRKVVELIFYIYRNPDFKEIKKIDKEFISKLKNINNELFELIRNHTTLSDKKLNEIFTKYDEDYIKRIFEYSIKQFKENKVRNLTAYFVKGLEENYLKLSPFDERRMIESTNKEKQKELAEDITIDLYKLNENYKKLLINKLDKFITTLSKEKRDKLTKSFLEKIINKHNQLENEYMKNGFNNELIQSKFRDFILKNFFEDIKFDYENLVDFLRRKKFGLKKLAKIEDEFKNFYILNLEILIDWEKKLKSLNLPSKLLMPFFLKKDKLLSKEIEEKVISYIYKQLDTKEKEKLIEEAKDMLKKEGIEFSKKELINKKLKKLIEKKYNL